ncbi:hypothetical protein DFQ28_004672 [Apophysomyces sp. BC1034]|nr:hypothetical protein DFQ30_005629 [Apophysomyces sp. BC1015]KAG0183087.1 hypothetical protein DFQ29_000090 [Apophysomyces sp. BC1021]KAG0193552.1 hypothetical protein DFQ28_004672 [Apophysomyces sp. BC1034]
MAEDQTEQHTTPCLATFLDLCSYPPEDLKNYVSHQFRQLNKRQLARLAKRKDPQSAYSLTVAMSESAEAKNRYIDIIPFDRNRVKLVRPELGRRGDRDYINASWIHAPFGLQRRYIASQGPLPSTVMDFWRMIVEQDVRVIVCLTPEVENGYEKCAAYWPSDGETKQAIEPLVDDEEARDGGFLKHPLPHRSRLAVLLRNIEETRVAEADCIVRQIEVTFMRTDQEEVLASTQVTQLQFLGWSDHGVPQQTQQVIELVKLANQCQPAEAGPMVIHCSAGCGRTGTFCVIDSGIEWMRQQSDDKQDRDGKNTRLDLVYELTDAFRKQRTTMVQAMGQYAFCYRALWDIYKQDMDR